MTIKELSLINYQCYYGKKTFELSKGSNIILGRNGGGKTKFFEALEWFFDSSNKQEIELVSKKAIFEAVENKPFDIGVEIIFENDNIQTRIKKYFSVELMPDKELSINKIIYEGERELQTGEREPIDGTNFINTVFPVNIRKYCFFKGESELNIFKNSNALAILLGMYSKIRYFGPYTDKGQAYNDFADKAVEDAVKKDKKTEKLYTDIDIQIKNCERELRRDETRYETLLNEKTLLEENLNEVENHLENADAVEKIKKRIEEIENKIKKSESCILEDYTTSLFDKNWFLLHFEDIQKQFSEKITKLSEDKRKLQSDFDKELGIKLGEKKARLQMLNDVVPLPLDIPSKAIMEEMLADEICKVCNRDAKIGSDAYKFMHNRLTKYLESQKPITEDEEEIPILFKNNYTSKLVNIDTTIDNNVIHIRKMYQSIKDLIEFNQDRKTEIEDLKIKRDKEINDLEQILGGSGLGQEDLLNAWKNSRGWKKDLTDKDFELKKLEENIKQLKYDITIKKREKDKIDTNSAHNFLIKTRDVIRDIKKIFDDTKESKYDEFVTILQTKANEYLKKINIGSFTGYIELKRRKRGNEETVDVVLMQNDKVFHHPNTSLQTSMHLAILFAISDLTKTDKEQSYPLIFDAPTSSFDTIKRKHFFEVLSECNEQTILLTKDFTDETSKSKGMLYSDEFKNVKRDTAYIIRLDEPFDQENLATINTVLTKI